MKKKPASLLRLPLLDALGHFFSGILHPLLEVVFMLFFIEVLRADNIEKTLLGLATRSGFLLAIPLSILLYRLRFKVNWGLFFFYCLAALSLSLVSRWPYVWAALCVVVLVNLPHNALHSLQAEIYTLYSKKYRARLFVFSSMAFLVGAIFFSAVTNFFLETQSQPFLVLFQFSALSLVIAALLFLQLPPLNFSFRQRLSFRLFFSILKTDLPFTKAMLAWFLLGSGNLWLIAYRPNLLVEEQFGFGYSEETVLLLLVGLPQLVCLVFSFPFAYLFDRFNFIAVRILINFFLMAYVFFFFAGGSFVMHCIGMVCFGLARAGGGLAWKLWVNHATPKEKVAGYMMVHSGLTGIRMFLAPLFGLWALNSLGPWSCALISFAFILVSTLLFFPMLSSGQTHFSH